MAPALVALPVAALLAGGGVTRYVLNRRREARHAASRERRRIRDQEWYDEMKR